MTTSPQTPATQAPTHPQPNSTTIIEQRTSRIRRTRTQTTRRPAANRSPRIRGDVPRHPHSRPRDPHGAHGHHLVGDTDPQKLRCRSSSITARFCAGSMLRESARLLPVRRGRLSIPPRKRRPDAYVRGRRRPVAHQPAFQAAVRGHAGQASFHCFRFRHAVRRRAARTAGHLRQGGQFGRVGGDARRHACRSTTASICARRKRRCR